MTRTMALIALCCSASACYGQPYQQPKQQSRDFTEYDHCAPVAQGTAKLVDVGYEVLSRTSRDGSVFAHWTQRQRNDRLPLYIDTTIVDGQLCWTDVRWR